MDLAWISLGQDARGEVALAYIPARPSSARECMIAAGHSESVDAWTGSTLRSAIEYHGRLRKKRVVLGLPSSPKCANLLAGLLDNDLPAHFCLTDDSQSVGAPPRNVILPSSVLRSVDEADAAADDLIDLGKAYQKRPVRFVASATSLLAESTFVRNSPIGTICTVMHERELNVMQSVLTDIGLDDRTTPRSGAELAELAASDGLEEAMTWLAAQSEALGLDVEVVVAAGSGRLRVKAGQAVQTEDSSYVEGHTIAISVGL